MTFVAPAGYSPSEREASPRSKSTATFAPVNSLGMPIATVSDQGVSNANAVAGPSGPGMGGTSSRRTSKHDLPISPSSAPPDPSVISVTHPPEFIHTHHPRRGSLTPLGLNVISPMLPLQMGSGSTHPPHSPVRSVGFTPTQAFPDAFPTTHHRRGSGASSSSTLTLSRPPQFGSVSGGRDRRRSSLAPAYPAGFDLERRRSSITPANPQLAPASPTRTHANGVLSRPGSSDGAPQLHARHHTTHGPRPLSSVRNQQAAAETRRGSMPQLHYGGWTGPRWNPSLPPQRGSVGEETLPDEGFKFGSISAAEGAGPSTTATSALRAIEISPSRRASKVKLDAFQEAEAAEAERQRRAFLAATYGEDGRRARERLSIGGPVAHAPSPSSPSARRPSLMLWEKLGMAAAAKLVEPELAASSAPTLILPKTMGNEDIGPRRGSLPIAIPFSPGSQSPSSRRGQFGTSPRGHHDEDFGEGEEYEQDASGAGESYDEYDPDRLAPIRPAPPLLPLSDPGPRLLPSTLALQRASHLLNSRNLQADPLPHPLPPSLHPPIPVDVTEFDIDFILAGSQSQLGRSKRSSNANAGVVPPLDVIAPFATSAPTPTLKLGGDDEDSFAKFVGKFDDEYGDRRGEWTFRAKGPIAANAGVEGPRAIWESLGAGAFEIFTNGDVRSACNGTTWRISRKGLCEYEIESVSGGSGFFDRLTPSTAVNERYILATKAIHCEQGGIKLSSSATPTSEIPSSAPSNRPSLDRPRPMKERLRVSISEATRTMRLDSSDTPATSKISSSLPSAITPKKKRRGSKEGEGLRIDSLPKLLRVKSKEPARDKEKEKERDKDKERDEEKGEKEKSSSGSFFKRGLMAPFKHTNFVAQYEEKRAQREERERERQQAHSWAGNASHAGFIHPSGKNTPPTAYNSPNPERSVSVQTTGTVASSVRTSSSDEPLTKFVSVQAASPLDPGSRGDSGLLSTWREGKAWVEVPDDAVAMVIPAGEVEGQRTQTLASISATSVDPRQALLVWYVPFNGEVENRDRERVSNANTPRPALQSSPSSDSHTPTPSSPSSSLPKFQKLLRRRTSKDKELIRNSSQRSSDVEQPPTPSRVPKHPLPFRSFRVVARIVDIDDLRSSSSLDGQPAEVSSSPASVPAPAPAPPVRPAALSVDSAAASAAAAAIKPKLTSNKTDETASSSFHSSGSTAPTSTILAGRTISTVIAVCHSRSQGVEFVLEGLDRLGYCTGESAWGPTGYEEWRGTGLSERGRELLELLWAGCTGVMGLTAGA